PSALVASDMGQKKQVLVHPNMDASLTAPPAVQRNVEALRTIAGDGCQILAARTEEGKQKFPAPDVLATEVAHAVNRQNAGKRILITMGTTRGYIDDVRYLSNYSSGGLGTATAEECCRHGYCTEVGLGPCPRTPGSARRQFVVQTTEEIARAVQNAAKDAPVAAIFAASLLDYAPDKRT